MAWVRPLSMLAVSMLDMAWTTCSLREAVCRRRGCLWRVLRELQSTELRALIRLMNASKYLRRGRWCSVVRKISVCVCVWGGGGLASRTCVLVTEYVKILLHIVTKINNSAVHTCINIQFIFVQSW